MEYCWKYESFLSQRIRLIFRAASWILLIVCALTPLPGPYRVSIPSCRQKNFLGKACDFPGAASRYENSWHPIFGTWLVGRPPLSPWAPPSPWGRRSDRVATGFSISACALTHTDAFTRAHPTRCTP